MIIDRVALAKQGDKALDCIKSSWKTGMGQLEIGSDSRDLEGVTVDRKMLVATPGPGLLFWYVLRSLSSEMSCWTICPHAHACSWKNATWRWQWVLPDTAIFPCLFNCYSIAVINSRQTDRQTDRQTVVSTHLLPHLSFSKCIIRVHLQLNGSAL